MLMPATLLNHADDSTLLHPPHQPATLSVQRWTATPEGIAC